VNLHVGARIPEDYLPDVHSRLILYKRIANAEREDDLDDLRAEVVDRFGALPEPLKQLFRVTGLKLRMQRLGIRRLDLGNEGGRVEFNTDTRVNPGTIVKLIQTQTATYRLDGGTQLRISRKLPDFDQRMAFAAELLDQLEESATANRAVNA
jgi:transcription-repair coupling factor (superfamily II helicase)